MDFVFGIDSNLEFSIDPENDMEFEINMPEKEYIEKESTPCTAAFSADALSAYLVSPVFRTEEEEDSLIHGN